MLTNILEEVSSPTGILLGVLLVVVVSWLWSAAWGPGPWGVPVLGYYPFLRADYHLQLHELAQKYGEVYLINIAGQNFVYLDSIRAIREAHVNQASYFPTRTRKHGILQATMGDGLVFNVGEQWRVQRKFFVQAMREIGIVPKTAERKGPIEDAIRETLQTFCDKQGEAVDVLPLMTKQCADVVLRLVLGNDITEEEKTKLSEEYAEMLKPMFGLNLVLMGNIAKWFLLPRVPGYNKMLQSSGEMKAVLRKIFQRHKESFDADCPPRDLIDLFLREKTLKETKGDPSVQHLTDLAFVSTLEQVYGDGSVSIAIFLSSFFLTISRYPEIQDTVHQEIVQVVGAERLPAWEDRPDLPITYSVMLEFFRKGTFVTVFPDMECSKDTTVLGVRVPKEYVTLMNIWAVNNNPEAYENPEQFDPTRFLPEKKVDPPFTFGLGKRACIGESLVMTEMFCFVASTLQSFRISPEKEAEQPAVGNDFEAAFDGRVRFLPRPGSRYAN